MLGAGSGNNIVTGGAGSDKFHFDAAGAGHTRVTDYEHGVDNLYFSNVQAQNVQMRLVEEGVLLQLDADTTITFEAEWDGTGLKELLL